MKEMNMKKIKALAVGVLLLCAAMLPTIPVVSAQQLQITDTEGNPLTYAIKGETLRVLISFDGTPVAGADVMFALPSTAMPTHGASNESGIAEYLPLITGTLRITARATIEGVLYEATPVEIPVTEVVVGPPSITDWTPVEAEVSDFEGTPRIFYITVNQTVNVTWLINGTQVDFDENVTEAWYKNASAVAGYWNVSVIVENENGKDMHTWMWTVTAVQPGNRTVVLVYNDKNIGYNFIAWTGSETNASSLVTLINSYIPGALPTGCTVSYYNTTKGYFDGFIVGVNPPGSDYDFTIQQYDVVCVRVAEGGTFLMPVPT